MIYRVRYTRGAREDLLRLYRFHLRRDVQLASRALDAIKKATEVLRYFPFTCRRAAGDNTFLRELLISFGSSGYVMLFEIEDHETVTILAVRHQLEDDYQ